MSPKKNISKSIHVLNTVAEN